MICGASRRITDVAHKADEADAPYSQLPEIVAIRKTGFLCFRCFSRSAVDIGKYWMLSRSNWHGVDFYSIEAQQTDQHDISTMFLFPLLVNLLGLYIPCNVQTTLNISASDAKESVVLKITRSANVLIQER